MKILHVLDHSLPLHSGYTFRTAAILREQRRLGWETVHLSSPKQGDVASEVETVDELVFHRTRPVRSALARLPGGWVFDQMRATQRRLESLARAERPDLLHAHSPVLDAWPALRVGRKLGLPVVYEVRAFWEDAAVDHGTHRESGLRYRLSRALETAAFRRADAITTICEGLRADIVARSIAADKVTVIPNAVDIDRFPVLARRDAELEARWGLAGHDVVGFCGSFYAYEGLDLLLRALPAIAALRPTVRLLLVGGGAQEPQLRALAQELGLAQRVIFAGRVPNAQIDRYYSLIDVLAFPRQRMRLTELVTPLKPLEAMAQGRAVVASDVGGHRELIRDEETGLLHSAGDAGALAGAVLRLLSDEPLRARLTGAARRFVETERSWAASVARYAPVYRRLVGSAAQGQGAALPAGRG
ncbi:MAG: glycosyltransferase, exosortase A system-associated [Burkholderiaceae bacterium]|nr:glycosyltransferase, exosortase A system-associated [Burkholderiaceae bacterium]